jgi:hypothetical protein
MRMTYQLGNNKSTHKQEARSLNKWPTAGSGYKNEGLTNNADLQVDSRCLLLEVASYWMYMKVWLHPPSSGIHIKMQLQNIHVNQEKTSSGK